MFTISNSDLFRNLPHMRKHVFTADDVGVINLANYPSPQANNK